MKKIIITITMLIAFIIPLTAFTWLGAVDASANLTGTADELSVEQLDRATLSFNLPFKTETSMSLSAKAFYELGYTFDVPFTSMSDLTHLVDVETLKYSIQLGLDESSTFSLDAGRFPISDLTTMIFNQVSDGVRATYENNAMKLNTYVGFTGFLNAYTVSMNVAPNEDILSEFYTLSSPFVLANVSLRLPQIFASQDMYAEVFSAIDVGVDGSGNATTDNRVYATIGLTGPLSSNFYYSLSSTAGFTQIAESEWGISNLSTVEVSTFLPFASSLLSWKTIFATGNNDNVFNTFTVNTANLDDSLEFAGHVKTGFVVTLRPISNILLFVEPSAIFDVMNEANGYEGFQWLFASKFGITSDLQLAASVGQFYSVDADIEPYLSADIKLSFMF